MTKKNLINRLADIDPEDMTRPTGAPFVRNPYNYDTNKAGDESGLDTGTEGGAKQSFKEECDINTIVKRFGIGYEMPQNHRIPQYGDFTGISDFHTAMNAVATAREAFDELPADIRAKFHNDPGKYVDFCLDDKNRDQLKEMGLLSAEALERDRIAEEQRNQVKEGGDKGGDPKTPQKP